MYYFQKNTVCAPAPESCVSHTVFYFLQVAEQVSLVHTVLQHLLKAVLYGCNIFVVGHAVPGVISLQNLHGHLAFTQQFSNENRDQILCFQRIFRYFRLEKLLETLLQNIQEIRCQAPMLLSYTYPRPILTAIKYTGKSYPSLLRIVFAHLTAALVCVISSTDFFTSSGYENTFRYVYIPFQNP